MANSVKRFAVSSAVYFIGNVLSKLAMFLLVPLYTKYLSPADYGYYDVSLAALSIFTSALFLEVWSTVLRFMFDEKGQDKYKVLYNGIVIMAISFLCYGIIACSVAWFFSIPSLEFIVLYGVFFCWQNFYAYAARGFGESTLFAVSGIVNTVVTILVNVTLIAGLKYGYTSLYIAAIAGMVAQILMLEHRIGLMCHFKTNYIQLSLIKDMVRYALPLSLNSLCYWLLTDYNRIIILKDLGLASNGVFAIAGKFAMALLLVSSCFTLAWQEVAFAKGGESGSPDHGAFYSQASSICTRFLLAGSIVLLPAISMVFPLMVDQAYGAARAIIPLYLLAIMTSVYSVFLGNIFGALKKTKIIFVSTIGACITNIIVIHTFIGIWDIQAASLALLAGYLVNIAIRIRLLNREINFKLEHRDILCMLPFLGVSIWSYFMLSYQANLLLFPSMIIIALFFLRQDLSGMFAKVRGK